MPTLTYVFDPYCPRSVLASPVVLTLWESFRAQMRFRTVHAGTTAARLGVGPDSERSARAFSALRAAAPPLEVPLMHELHQALGVRGERLGRRTLIGIAHRLDIEPAAVFDALRHPQRREHARTELARGRSLQLDNGPALLFEHDHIITSMPVTGEPLQPVIAAILSPHRTLAAR